MSRENAKTRVRADAAAWALRTIGAVGGALLAFITVAASLLPYRTVFAGNTWLVTVGLAAGSTALGAALVLALGEAWQQRSFSSRRGVVIGVLAQLIGFTAGLVTLATQFARPIPNPALPWRVRMQIIVDFYAALTYDGLNDAYEGHPPMFASPGVLWLMGLVAIMLSLVYLTTIVLVRTPAVALVVALITAALPMILVGENEASFLWIVSAAVLSAVLLTTRVRALDQEPRERVRSSGTRLIGVITSLAAAVIVAAIVTTTVTMPRPVLSFLPGKTVGLTLTLGDDLRVPVPRPVLEVRTAGPAPYLRIGTLTQLQDGIWLPDPVEGYPLTGVPHDGPFVDQEERPESRPVEIMPLAATVDYAPVPYPLRSIAGLNENWHVLSQNLTVRNLGASLGNTPYSVLQEVVEPTRDEIETARAAVPTLSYGVDTLSAPRTYPSDMRLFGERDEQEVEFQPGDPEYERIVAQMTEPIIPERFSELAATITEAATSDVEKAQSIERYLRNNFEYSLTAPVEQGFDGSDITATERFLDAGTGYCVHFTSAFTLMARAAGLPTRIVVGYLPGQYVRSGEGDQRVYEVFSDQAHSWPEVHFEGIGWVAFEPTASIGSPTTFTNATSDSNEATPTPTASETPTPTATPTPTQTSSPGAIVGGSSIWPVVGAISKVLAWVLLAALLLAIPALVRVFRRRRRTRLMTTADAPTAANASWQELRDTLVDAGLEAPSGETIRQFGKRMRSSGVSAELITEYTQKLEDAAYKPEADASDLAELTQQLRTAVIATASRGNRRRAAFAPRSLRR